ncbi:MAG: HesA/MoeB/ThiF family protein [Muribaculaceae bacterium]|nr:HesA/MoeB/ThiF family protein [Muribaculaceae bacterium]
MKTDRYSRQTMLDGFGEEGQRRLAQSRVLIAGAGGLGSAAALYLAGAGVGHIAVADADTVSLSNLQRQVLYSEAEVGRPKAACAAARLHALNSDVCIEPIDTFITSDNASTLLQGRDIVLDCTDNFATRYIIDDACAAASIPWIYASIGEFEGQLSLFGGNSGTRYADLYPDREALCSRPRTVAGVLGAVPGVLGAMQAAEAVKYLLGMGENLDGRLLCINLLTFDTSLIKL